MRDKQKKKVEKGKYYLTRKSINVRTENVIVYKLF